MHSWGNTEFRITNISKSAVALRQSLLFSQVLTVLTIVGGTEQNPQMPITSITATITLINYLQRAGSRVWRNPFTTELEWWSSTDMIFHVRKWHFNPKKVTAHPSPHSLQVKVENTVILPHMNCEHNSELLTVLPPSCLRRKLGMINSFLQGLFLLFPDFSGSRKYIFS